MFFSNPLFHFTVVGEKLKRLLEQRWTGHLATAATVLNFFQPIALPLQKPRMEVSELPRDLQEQSPLLIAEVLCNL